MISVKYRTLYIKLLIIFTVFNGFIHNFIKLGSMSIGTLLFDFYIVALAGRLIIGAKKEIRLNRSIFAFLTLFVFISCGVLMIMPFAFSSMYESVAGIRNHVLYMLVFLEVFVLSKGVDINKLLLFLLKCCYLITCYALFQYVFNSRLPSKFLIVDGAEDFRIWGVASYRCTGLVGDMIAYGGFSTITIVMLLVYLEYNKKNIMQYLLLLVPVVTNILTFNRTSMLVMAFTTVVTLLFLNKRKLVGKVAALCAFAVSILAAMYKTGYLNLILERFFNKSVNKYTNARHFDTYVIAIRELKEHFFTGVGLGTQMASSRGGRIVYDGYWWECALEMGIPIFLIFFGFYVYSIIWTLNNNRKYKNQLMYNPIYCFSAVFFLLASCVNSSFEARTNFALVMMLFGLAMREYLDRNRVILMKRCKV